MIYIMGELNFEETLPDVDYEILVEWEEDSDGIDLTVTLNMNGESRDITNDLSASDYNYLIDKVMEDAND